MAEDNTRRTLLEEPAAPTTASRPRVRLKSVYELYAARNSLLTEDTLASILSYLEEGLPVIHTCAMVGISETTWYRWEKRGRVYLDHNQTKQENPEEEIYGRFCEAVKKAQANYQLGKLRTSLN